VIDPRSLVPMDWDTIFRSVDRTGRLVIVDPAFRTCSAAAEIAATVSEERSAALLGPPVRVTAPDVQMPFSPGLEREIIPDRADVVAGVLRALGRPIEVSESVGA
jgi:pyruvate dehydrogenase E1 component beta subunit